MIRAHLVDKGNLFILETPHTPKTKDIAASIGGRKIPQGFSFPRLMNIYDQLHERIPTLNTLEFPSSRGFGLVDKGQEQHSAWPKLRGYQRDTVDVLLSNPHPGTLVELSPGLGKSPVTVIAADIAKFEHVLFVAVKSLRRNWEREIKQWTGRTAHQRFQEGPVDGWNITNFETLVQFYKHEHPEPTKNKKTGEIIPAVPAVANPYRRTWDLIVVDESVLIKNRKAIRTKALLSLREKATYVWCLTGSPTTRYADDLWSQLHLVHPQAFGSYWRFAKRFCIIDENVWGTKIVGTNDRIDFAWELRDVMVSLNQKDVLDLPPLLHESVDLDLLPEQQRVYDELMESFVAELESGVQLSAQNKMARLIRLQQVVSGLANLDGGDHSTKADAVVELIEAQAVQFPLLIWIHWTEGANKLYERLSRMEGVKAAIVTGQTKDADVIIQQYKDGKINVLLLSLGVGKFGHTLIDTRSAIYVDRTFDGDAYYQSLHRLDRFGLKHSPQVVTLRCPGTVEELVEQNIAGKLETISLVTDADLAKLLRSIGR